MKSAYTVVQGLYIAIFEDLYRLHPSIERELRRDISRLVELGRSSGLAFYTITLPSLSKFLERSLDEGRLVSPRPPHAGARSKLDQRPTLLNALWSMIFRDDGTLKDNEDISAIASLRQVFLAVKKLRLECEKRYVDDAIEAFLEIEKSLPRSWDDTWDCDNPRWSRHVGHPIWGAQHVDDSQADMFDYTHPVLQPGTDLNWEGFGTICARFASQLGSLCPFELIPKHGPGAVSDKASRYVKYDMLNWTKRLESVFPYDWFGAPSPEHLDYVQYKEFPSRLIAVPKTQSGPRLIASEPTSHQWIQGGIERWLSARLKQTFINDCVDFGGQEYSRALALSSSLDGEFATVDLSSASDRLTTRLVEYVFQSNRTVLDALHASRTRVVEVPGREHVLLRKFSTQGSACTFPVQTIVFTLLALWSVMISRNESDYSHANLTRLAKEVRVFGDDIIVPIDAYPVLTTLLASCLLKVNTSKSFGHGKFRESCGMDAYAGVDVTPAYFREQYSPAPTSLESVIECSNNFHKKGMWNAADYLLKTVPSNERVKLIVRGTDDGALGLYSFCGTSLQHLRSRWNEELHRHEVRCIQVRSEPKYVRGQGHGSLMQFFHEEPSPDLPYRGGQSAEGRSRKTVTWVSIDEIEGERS